MTITAKPPVTKQLIRVGHSPDPDDAFMFHALANGKIDTGPYEFRHELVDIETLNRRAFAGRVGTDGGQHPRLCLFDRQVHSLPVRCSMGDRYGPMVVAPQQYSIDDLGPLTIAVPGTLTTAYLALRLCLRNDFQHVVVPFDQIIDAAVAGTYQGQPIDAGLIIHEGQLTYADRGLKLAVDLGQWWFETNRPAVAAGRQRVRGATWATKQFATSTACSRKASEYGLEHRDEALDYALQYGRDLDRSQADRFVGMYVNDWTLDFGPRGREAVRRLLAEGHAAGVIPQRIVPEFAES